MKVFDIVTPKDNWERGFAHLQWLFTELKSVGAKKIEVKNG